MTTPDRPPPAERLYRGQTSPVLYNRLIILDAKKREEKQALKARQLLEEEKIKLEREKEERIRGGIPTAALKEKEKIEIQGELLASFLTSHHPPSHRPLCIKDLSKIAFETVIFA